MTPPPRSLLVVGAGLMGASIAWAVRRGWPDVQVTGIDRAAVWADHPRRGFDDVLTDDAALPACELVVLACPVDVMPGWMARLAAEYPSVPVTDVGGVKRSPARAAASAGLHRFVGGHPMAGASRPGPSLASDELFEGRPWFVVPGAAPADAVAMVHSFVAACGAYPVDIDADRHDAMVAALSHLPQVTASLLMAYVADAAGAPALAYAGDGLRDTTRLAEGAVDIWLPVLAANREHLAPMLLDLADRLRLASATLGDADAMTRLFAEANRARRSLVSAGRSGG